MIQRALFITALFLSLTSVCFAEDKSGEVKLGLADYNNLTAAAREPKAIAKPAPASYALGAASVKLNVTQKDSRASAGIAVTLNIKTLVDEWVSVPILPAGTPVSSVKIDNKTVELMATGEGLSWGVKKAGSYVMKLHYSVDAASQKEGFSLPIPVPAAAAIKFEATLPGSGLDVAVIPSAGTNIDVVGDITRVITTVPSTSGIHLSWRIPHEGSPAISRARYSGELVEKAVSWTSVFSVELFNDESAAIELLPNSVTLNDVNVDGQKASIIEQNNRFATILKGRGKHEVKVSFQVPVISSDGPPRIDLQIPRIPVSRFELILPGKKDVSVSPTANVETHVGEDSTTATAYVPMTERVTLSWAEAVPEEIKTEVRANANVYHLVHAEEGVLYVRALASYDITRGETSIVQLEVPEDVQINRITADAGVISDWRVVPRDGDKPRTLSVFFDRKIKNTLPFDIYYDYSLIGENSKGDITVPLLRALDVHRQRGMVALLSSKELTLKPIEEKQVTRVGENQLPAAVRQAVDMTIAHTYKYVETAPTLVVQTTTPERKQGKFDALVNTLISLGDVTMKGAASVEVNVKSGSIMDLQLKLPPEVNFLSLTAPSLRTHKINPTDDGQVIDVSFTQEMEGQFRIEISYELIMSDSASEVKVPTLAVDGAEVEQGRIAVEALTAVEVRAAKALQLSSLDPNELPQQLILKTTNPILLGYKYVHVDPPYELTLRITRHKEINVQRATIDKATYRTLFTEDGLAVTAAEFLVRNSREQFLRVSLPEGARVWSAFVDGKPEKPAVAGGQKENSGSQVLIKIINSSRGFLVNLIYQMPVDKIGTIGMVQASLPRPDMVVTNSHWEVYLPEAYSYGKADSNMTVLNNGSFVSREVMNAMMSKKAMAGNGSQAVEPLHIHVPTAGIRFVFEKLYANQSDEEASFSVPYTSGAGALGAHLIIILGTVFMWLGLGALVTKDKRVSPREALGSLFGGALVLAFMIGYFGVSHLSALIVSGMAIIGGAGVLAKSIVEKREADPNRTEASASEKSEEDKVD